MPNAPTFKLVRREAISEELLFKGGEATVDERLAMRGILVGVSFVRAEEAEEDIGGGCISLCSRD